MKCSQVFWSHKVFAYQDLSIIRNYTGFQLKFDIIGLLERELMQDFCPKKVGLVTDSLDLIDSYDYSVTSTQSSNKQTFNFSSNSWW